MPQNSRICFESCGGAVPLMGKRREFATLGLMRTWTSMRRGYKRRHCARRFASSTKIANNLMERYNVLKNGRYFVLTVCSTHTLKSRVPTVLLSQYSLVTMPLRLHLWILYSCGTIGTATRIQSLPGYINAGTRNVSDFPAPVGSTARASQTFATEQCMAVFTWKTDLNCALLTVPKHLHIWTKNSFLHSSSSISLWRTCRSFTDARYCMSGEDLLKKLDGALLRLLDWMLYSSIFPAIIKVSTTCLRPIFCCSRQSNLSPNRLSSFRFFLVESVACVELKLPTSILAFL